MIKLSNITVKYNDNVIYKDFSFDFQDKVNVILGKSGCGKTTLINVIANLIKYEGNCQTDGKVSIVFQKPYLSNITVYENIDAILPKGSNEKQIDEILKMVHLFDKKNINVNRLSGGEAQRVALARAFISNRKILLLDEPFSNLDYGERINLQSILNELLNVYDKTVILVTHNIDEALSLADSIYLLKDRPCNLNQVIDISIKRNDRDEFSYEMLQLKKNLQDLLK